MGEETKSATQPAAAVPPAASDSTAMLVGLVRKLRSRGILSHEDLAELLDCADEPFTGEDGKPVKQQLFDSRQEPVRDEKGAPQHRELALGHNHHATQAELDKRLTAMVG